MKRSVAAAARVFLTQRGARQGLKRLTVRYPTREVFRFWQPGGGFDHNIFKEKTLAAVVEYIHANPFRRGLVGHPTDWEWSSAILRWKQGCSASNGPPGCMRAWPAVEDTAHRAVAHGTRHTARLPAE